LRLDERRIAILASQLGQTTGRLERLAGLRAEYANLVAETNHRTKLVERAEQNMAEARASRASAKAASLISRIDGPDTGIRPVSPSPATILVAGILGGLVAGFGVVMLTVAPRRPEEAPAIGGRPAEPLPLAVRPQAVLPAVLSRGARNGKLSLTQALEKAIADRARLTAMQP
jgi:hypothetical protein